MVPRPYACLRPADARNPHRPLSLLLVCSFLFSFGEQGDFPAAKELLARVTEEGDILQPYILSLPHSPQWTLLSLSDEAGGAAAGATGRTLPGCRGGHQMCMARGKLFLFGGWDGQHDLNDLWVFDVASGEWTCLSEDTEKDGGPDARSCHKMCIDEECGQIYLLGKYIDRETVAAHPLTSDFYRYDIAEHSWTLLTDDTAAAGGPRLIYDHQMSFDSDSKILYVFGGRILSRDGAGGSSAGVAEPSLYSGLYAYDVHTQVWLLLR